MMTKILEAVSPRDNKGNDPNDFRTDRRFLGRVLETAKQNDLDWTKAFTMSLDEANAIKSPEWVYPNLIIRGHLLAIPAPPNGGKTTILAWVSGEIASNYRVYYVNADISATDAKQAVIAAEAKNYTLLVPDMKAGLSMDNVIQKLVQMNDEGGDYSDIVFIFDTLKKMTDVINKSRAKELYKTLRGLTAKGMTIVLLAHTNKYSDADGKPVYEGTGDLRADVDELIYLIPQKRDDGSMVVSTDPLSSTSKVRGVFRPITFHITPDRDVSLAPEFVDVASQNRIEMQREKDLPVIAAIESALDAGITSQTAILDHCKANHVFGWRVVQSVLKRWATGPDRLWDARKGFEKNRMDYSRVLPQ